MSAYHSIFTTQVFDFINTDHGLIMTTCVCFAISLISSHIRYLVIEGLTAPSVLISPITKSRQKSSLLLLYKFVIIFIIWGTCIYVAISPNEHEIGILNVFGIIEYSDMSPHIISQMAEDIESIDLACRYSNSVCFERIEVWRLDTLRRVSKIMTERKGLEMQHSMLSFVESMKILYKINIPLTINRYTGFPKPDELLNMANNEHDCHNVLSVTGIGTYDEIQAMCNTLVSICKKGDPSDIILYKRQRCEVEFRQILRHFLEHEEHKHDFKQRRLEMKEIETHVDKIQEEMYWYLKDNSVSDMKFQITSELLLENLLQFRTICFIVSSLVLMLANVVYITGR